MRFAEYVKIREEKFGAVIFETLKEKVYVTNEIGKDILTRLRDGYTVEEIIDLLVERYSEDRILVERDLNNFVTLLFKNGLVRDADDR